jgi:hypothetical protein
MSATSSSLNRRGFLASSAAVVASGLFATAAEAAAEDGAIRPFHIDVPEEQLVDLRRRLAASGPQNGESLCRLTWPSPGSGPDFRGHDCPPVGLRQVRRRAAPSSATSVTGFRATSN